MPTKPNPNNRADAIQDITANVHAGLNHARSIVDHDYALRPVVDWLGGLWNLRIEVTLRLADQLSALSRMSAEEIIRFLKVFKLEMESQAAMERYERMQGESKTDSWKSDESGPVN